MHLSTFPFFLKMTNPRLRFILPAFFFPLFPLFFQSLQKERLTYQALTRRNRIDGRCVPANCFFLFFFFIFIQYFVLSTSKKTQQISQSGDQKISKWLIFFFCTLSREGFVFQLNLFFVFLSYPEVRFYFDFPPSSPPPPCTPLHYGPSQIPQCVFVADKSQRCLHIF